MMRTKIPFGVMDIFIIVLILACIAGVVGRYVLTDKNGILAVAPEEATAAVHVLIADIENTSSSYFAEGSAFRLGESETPGELYETPTVRPAERYAENEEGELYITYDDEENGKKDVRCTIIVTGSYRDGIFVLDGDEPVLPGANMLIAGDKITVTALILDVTPVQTRSIS